MKGSDYKCHKTNPTRGRSNTDYPNWIRNKKAALNPINDHDKCFQKAATVTLNHEQIGRNSQGTTKTGANRGRNVVSRGTEHPLLHEILHTVSITW